MRLFMIILCLVFFGPGCSSSGSKGSAENATEKTNMSEEHLIHIQLDVSGMTCEGCENAIVASINTLEGIQEATASHTDQEAMIVFDSTKTTVHEIAHAIEEAGYRVEGESVHPNR